MEVSNNNQLIYKVRRIVTPKEKYTEFTSKALIMLSFLSNLNDWVKIPVSFMHILILLGGVVTAVIIFA